MKNATGPVVVYRDGWWDALWRGLFAIVLLLAFCPVIVVATYVADNMSRRNKLRRGGTSKNQGASMYYDCRARPVFTGE